MSEHVCGWREGDPMPCPHVGCKNGVAGYFLIVPRPSGGDWRYRRMKHRLDDGTTYFSWREVDLIDPAPPPRPAAGEGNQMSDTDRLRLRWGSVGTVRLTLLVDYDELTKGMEGSGIARLRAALDAADDGQDAGVALFFREMLRNVRDCQYRKSPSSRTIEIKIRSQPT